MIASVADATQYLRRVHSVSRETETKLEKFVALILAHNATQNLISKASEAEIWSRHIADSAQLITLCPSKPRADQRWVDLGSGAGLPGIVIAIIAHCRVTLIESRRLRCDFLRLAVDALDLNQCDVVETKVKAAYFRDPVAFISARAFAPLPKVIAAGRHIAHENTLWLLPKGKNGVNELAMIPKAWQTMFHVKPSVTADDSVVLVGRGKFGGGRR